MGPMGPRGLGPIKQKKTLLSSYYVVIIILIMMIQGQDQPSALLRSWPWPLAPCPGPGSS